MDKVEFKGMTFLVRSELELYRVNSMFEKEPETIKWIDKYLKPESVFWDVGANIGIFSKYALSREPFLKVVSIEPDFKNYQSLVNNLSFEKGNVLPIFAGITNREGVFEFTTQDDRPGSSGGQIVPPSSGRGLRAVFSIDWFAASYKAFSPTMIKIDIDGLEELVIDGSKNLLSSGAVKTLLIEYDCKKVRDRVEGILLSMGFSLDDDINLSKEHSNFRRAEKNSSIRNVVYYYDKA